MELRSQHRKMGESPTVPPEEQAGPSGVPPPRKKKRQAPKEEVCGLCRRGDCDPEIFGQLCHQNRLLIHENCLYHASRLMQRGADEEGFYGFLFPDIRQELKRVAQKRCCICRLQGASVTCKSRRCRRTFHFPCGSERGCISQFFGEFKSFCWKHRPVQRVRAVQHGQTPCLICLEAVAGRPTYDTLVCPACASAWFHRRCIQGQALRSALHYFCCPLCRDMATFQAEMFRLGIKIPDRDAAWEEEDGAFAEHYERHSSCDAGLCLCPAGREQAEVNGPWRLLLCSSCGSRGTHQLCSAVGEDANSWECADCRGTGTGEWCSWWTGSPGPPQGPSHSTPAPGTLAEEEEASILKGHPSTPLPSQPLSQNPADPH
ncbi:PHD finger protein 7-like [Grus americana]|uniref:PHD finger protein 7-like n=1 Tax=Grus americana TaxID=9117 RepID=UPI00240829EC|nr:PHD finger protein 7-like [Grus americana]